MEVGELFVLLTCIALLRVVVNMSKYSINIALFENIYLKAKFAQFFLLVEEQENVNFLVNQSDFGVYAGDVFVDGNTN